MEGEGERQLMPETPEVKFLVGLTVSTFRPMQVLPNSLLHVVMIFRSVRVQQDRSSHATMHLGPFINMTLVMMTMTRSVAMAMVVMVIMITENPHTGCRQ